MENNWHEKLFDFSSNPSYITITCVGIEPRTTGCKSDTLTRDYLPALKSMVNIILKYVTLNTTHAFNRSPIFVSGSLSVSIIGYGVPFLSYYMRVLLIDLHKYGKPSVPQFDFNKTRSETPARAPERVPVFQNAFHWSRIVAHSACHTMASRWKRSRSVLFGHFRTFDRWFDIHGLFNAGYISRERA